MKMISLFSVSLAAIFLYLVGASSALYAEEHSSKPYIFLFSGPPGSGRTTVLVKIHSSFGIPLISSADLVMEHIHDDSNLGEMAREHTTNGGSLSDDFFFQAFFERIGKGGCQRGLVLDGMPQELSQAELLFTKLSKTFNLLAFDIDVPDSWLIERVQGRLFCPQCGQVYCEHGCHNDPAIKEILRTCDSCKVQLQRRQKDDPKVLSETLKEYRLDMDPILQFYKSKGLLVKIRGDRTIDEMSNEISEFIEAKTGIKRTVSCVCHIYSFN